MKKSNILLSLTLLSLTTVGQWAPNPTNPVTVCDATGDQTAPQSFPDENGGVFVFWLDGREGTDTQDLYGQHYNAEGIAQWETQGREIVNYPQKIEFFRTVAQDDGGFIFLFYVNQPAYSAEDGLFIRRIDAEGQAIWPSDVMLMDQDYFVTGIADIHNAQIFTVETGYLVFIHHSTFGGNHIRFSRFDADGNLLLPFNGVLLSNWTGFIAGAGAAPDYQGGAYVYYSSCNCLGGALWVNRVNHNGELLWNNWVAPTGGSPGIGYEFGAVSDPGGITAVWGINSYQDILAKRIDADGNYTWGDDYFLPVCTAEGAQNQFVMNYKDGEITILWRDTRVGVFNHYGVWGQRFTTAGEFLWEPDGIEIISQHSNNPNPVFRYADNGSIIVMAMDTPNNNNIATFTERVTKVAADGTKVWDEDVIVGQGYFATHNFQKTIVMSGTNIVAVWRGSQYASAPNNPYAAGPNDIYIALVEDLINYVEETVVACNEYSVSWTEQVGEETIIFEEILSESGIYTYELPGDTILTLDLTIISFAPEIEMTDSGLVSTEPGLSYSWIDCNTGEFLSADSLFVPSVSGLYGLQVDNGVCNYSTACLYVPVYIYVDSTLAVCDGLNLDGMVISESGIYNLFMPGDTIIVLNLTVETLTATVLQNGNALSFQPAEAELLQWVDCDTGMFLSQDSVFEIEETGNYACVISLGACTAASECLEYIYTGVDEMTSTGILLYPNPGNHQLNIVAENGHVIHHVRLTDLAGRTVAETTPMAAGMVTLDTSALPAGWYAAVVSTHRGMVRLPWVKGE